MLLCPAALALLLKGADFCWIPEIWIGSRVSEVSFLAQGDVRFALRPRVFERRLPGHLRFVEIGKAVIGESKEKCDEVVDFGLTERKALHASVKERIGDAALVVMVHDVP